MGIKSFAIGTAVAAGGAWFGDVVGGIVGPMLPAGSNGAQNPIFEKIVRYAIIGIAVSTAIHLVKRKG